VPSPGARCYHLEGATLSEIGRKCSDKTGLGRVACINRFSSRFARFAGDNTKQMNNVADLRTALHPRYSISHRQKKNNDILPKIRYFLMGNCVVICFPLLRMPDRRK